MNSNQPRLLGFCESCDNINLRISMKFNNDKGKNKLHTNEKINYKSP